MDIALLLSSEKEPFALRCLSKLTFRHSGAWLKGHFYRQYSGTYANIDFPATLLPYLRPGRVYDNGRITSQVEGRVRTLRIEDLAELTLVTGEFFSPEVHEYLGLSHHLQPTVFYQVRQKNQEIYIPASEIIRALYMPTSFYVNRVLSALGLTLLYEYFPPGSYDKHRIAFTDKMPVNLINNSFAAHFAWMVTDPASVKSWSTIYTDLLSLHPQERSLTCRLPRYSNIRLEIGSDSVGGYQIGREIYRIGGIVPSFKSLKYSHPKIRTPPPRIPGDGPDKPSDEGKPHTEFDFNDYGDSSQFDKKSRQYRIPRTKLGFKLDEVSADIKPSDSNPNPVPGGNGGPKGGNSEEDGEVKKVSIQPQTSGGECTQLLLDGLDSCTGDYEGDLEDIDQVVNKLRELAPAFSVSSGIFYFPEVGRKKFAKLSGGVLRAAYIATFEYGTIVNYLIEPDRSTDYQISTLIMKTSVTKRRKVEAMLSKVLSLLVENSGSWPKEKLETALKGYATVSYISHRRTRPVGKDQSLILWAHRILKKM